MPDPTTQTALRAISADMSSSSSRAPPLWPEEPRIAVPRNLSVLPTFLANFSGARGYVVGSTKQASDQTRLVMEIARRYQRGALRKDGRRRRAEGPYRWL